MCYLLGCPDDGYYSKFDDDPVTTHLSPEPPTFKLNDVSSISYVLNDNNIFEFMYVNMGTSDCNYGNTTYTQYDIYWNRELNVSIIYTHILLLEIFQGICF